MSSSPSERRRAARVPAAIPVELRDRHGFSLHSSSDISSGGAFFDRSIPHRVGSKVTVSFTLPGEKEPIVCEGEVVNVPDKRSFGMGVRFLNVKEADQKKLDAFRDQDKKP
jgi:uncharacterized protein (TIGR02266 family)